MRFWLFVLLVVLGALVYFRSGRRWGSNARGNLIALLVFVAMLASMVALLVFALRLF
jgi:hypothetical protein